ncbi:hypothetical protein GALL_46830 [mine drainage metagenome]|uniref:Methane oxygenase PmoA n=1 Tax=mine drainage metagenome TaxID=410659 RepID=A0A1J5TD36_9ZZZZ
MKKLFFLSTLFFFCLFINTVYAQKQLTVKLKDDKQKHEVLVTINGKAFTNLLYDDTLYKPILYPVYSPAQQLITRGFPLAPRSDEPTDHPHHQGIWFNYENVNGLDFWNNSYAIPASKKSLYGSIKTDKIISLKNGTTAELKMSARWIDHNNSILLKEQTTYLFSGNEEERIIDRITTLTSVTDVVFNDAKDGLLGLRIAKELQIPTIETKKFVDDKGNVTLVKAIKDSTINGNYLTSEGKEGDSAWATRANWCLLYGKKNNEMISIAIIDHPQNIGYPTYWHARGYGLFAANPLGQKIFSNGKEDMHFTLKKGSSATFRYRIVIAGGIKKLSNQKIDQLAKDFSTIDIE